MPKNPVSKAQQHFLFSPKTKVIDQSTIYLTNQDGIDSLENYIDLLEYFRSKEEGDEVTIVISGLGGDLNTSIALSNVIAESKAIVIADVLGTVASGHAMVTLACDAIITHSGSNVMLHTFSGGAYGKGLDGASSLTSTNAQLREVLLDYVQGFMTEDEIDSMLEKNRDLFFTGDDLRQRILNLYKYRQDAGLNKGGMVFQFEEETSIDNE